MNLEEIKLTIAQLSPEEFSEFRKWFNEEYEAILWDKQIESDILAGQLDEAANEAINAFQNRLPK